MKIALINLNNASRGFFPLGISYLGGVLLKKKSYDVRLYDSAFSAPAKIIREVIEYSPDIIGLSFISMHSKKAKETAIILKETEAVIAAGGPHATAMPQDVLSEKAIDFVVCGEGEDTFAQLCDAIMNKTDITSIAGIAYRDADSGIKFTSARPLIEDLDQLPALPYELLSIERYIKQFMTNPALGFRGMPIMASRGCPYNCIFCQPMHGKAVRYRSVANVIEEMVMLKKKYKLKGFNFCDDSLTANRDWILKLCKEIVLNKDLKGTVWSCSARVDRVDQYLLNEMALAGCRTVWYGIESGCQESLRQMRKGAFLTQATSASRWTKNAGIGLKVNMLIGFPWEDEQMIYNTVRFTKSLKPDHIQFSCVMPWPGTQLYQDARESFYSENGRYPDFDYTRGAVMPTRHLSVAELEKVRRDCLFKLYLDPRYVLRSVLNNLHSARQLMGYFQRFKNKLLTKCE